MTDTSNERLVLVLNCGSSSIKFAVFEVAIDPLPRRPRWNGKVQGIGGPAPDFGETGVPPFRIPLDAEHPYRGALQFILERIATRLDGRNICAVAHRVVHGGSKYFAPVRVDAAVLADLKSYVPLAPLHQPFALEAIDILLRERPEVPQIACFDTGFHRTLPQVEQALPLPYDAWQRGLRRHGFHGLSYEYMATALVERHGEAARGRTIVAHLGSGASLCAMRDLQSIATTMGFSALDGLMMGTRTGALDPGVILYLLENKGMGLQELSTLLYKQSGLLGVSGISQDMRTLLASEAPAAGEAVELFCYRAVGQIGALAAAIGGLDALVFTGGIGEHAAAVRARIVDACAWLGLKLDATANDAGAGRISAADSRTEALVIPTDEEWMIAQHTQEVLAG